jgi:hypothetical protein
VCGVEFCRDHELDCLVGFCYKVGG